MARIRSSTGTNAGARSCGTAGTRIAAEAGRKDLDLPADSSLLTFETRSDNSVSKTSLLRNRIRS